MKFAYPQDATSSISAVRRLDESSDAATQQSNLERKQDIATVGETVPLIFCNRSDYGNDQGITGGVWISPRLIQLGLGDGDLSMMYLLSQGKVDGLEADNVHWGYKQLNSVDPSAVFCYAYENIPDCLDLDYVPGGSLVWTTTVTDSGPSGEGSFVTEPDCIKIALNWDSFINVKGSGQLVGGFAGLVGAKGPYYNQSNATVAMLYPYEYKRPGTVGPADWPYHDTHQPSSHRQTTWWMTVNPNDDWKRAFYATDYSYIIQDPNVYPSGYVGAYRYWDFGSRHLQASWDQDSEVRLDIRVIRVSDETVVKTAQVWVKHGKTSYVIDGLDPDVYRVEFDNLYKERNTPYSTVTFAEPNPADAYAPQTLYYQWTKPQPTPPQSGFVRATTPGQETQNINLLTTQTIFNELKFPEIPGGDGQLSGGMEDLTMCGVSGDILALRPQDGPDYFKQLHIFVEQGIEVQSLLTGRVEPSKYYPDLVRYLFQQTQALNNDQIDVESLTLACRMHQRYSMFFNGVLQTTSNLATWLTKTAPYFLCTPRQVDGRYGLAPIAPLDSNYEFSRDPVVPDHIFGADEITADSYTRTYISPVDRRPICLVMVYRDQPEQSPGQTVTVEVRYPGTALSGPFEQHDLTEFCCTPGQAIYAARYILAQRRYTTHTCNMTVDRAGRNIIPGQIVRVDLALQTSEGAGVNDTIFYQVESVQEGQAGMVNLELIHFPVDSNGVSIIAKEVHEGAVTIQ